MIGLLDRNPWLIQMEWCWWEPRPRVQRGSLVTSRMSGSTPLGFRTGTYMHYIQKDFKKFRKILLQDCFSFWCNLLWEKFFCCFSEINEIYHTPAQLDVTPISGYLIYLEGNREKNLTLTSLQDQEEESEEVFSVRLLGAKNGGTLSETDHTAILTSQWNEHCSKIDI